LPTLLRFDAIRLFEASMECLNLAISSIGTLKRTEFRQPAATYAAEVGLIGAAAELSMSACLVQAYGQQAITMRSGQYKTAGRILHDFRQLIREAPYASEFLTQGIENPVNHRNKLYQCTLQFRILISARAGGLHAGRGLARETVVYQANNVTNFLELLSLSTKIHPYLSYIPRCMWYAEDRQIIIEDLTNRLRQAGTVERPEALASVFLALPDVPEETPEWVNAFDRVSVSPRQRDIAYLLNTLENALPVTLRRTGDEGANLNVVVRPEDPDALPIAPQYLRRQFNQIPDQYHADVGNANGRLDDGYIDVSPPEAVREIFALGIERSGILNESNSLNAHQSWPGIVSSLSIQGTSGPYWFFIRKTSDLGQLKAILQRVGEFGGRTLKTRIRECIYGIETIMDNRHLQKSDDMFGDLLTEIDSIDNNRNRLMEACERNYNNPRALPEELYEELQNVVELGKPIGPLLMQIISQGYPIEVIKYWPRMLCDCAQDLDDLPALIIVLATVELKHGHTAARKALRRIDFLFNGPSII